jgi:hypothetical protein
VNYQKHYDARDIIEDIMEEDLIGPLQENEIISDTDPIKYYSMGILYPQGYMIEQTENEKNPTEDGSESQDKSIDLSNSAYPSSFGLSFTVKPNTEKFEITSSYAWYTSQEKMIKASKEEHSYIWTRGSDLVIKVMDTKKRKDIFPLKAGLDLHVYMQKEYPDGAKTFTVALVNTNIAGTNSKINNELSFFQLKTKVSGIENSEGIFIERRLKVAFNKDPELLNLEMLYRHNKTFAIGHGCSVDWESIGDYAVSIQTTFLPKYELLQMKPASHVNPSNLSFKFLSESNQDQVYDSMQNLIDSYGKWITDKKEASKRLQKKFQKAAKQNLEACAETLTRIKEAIEALKREEEIFTAFQLANKAMLNQLVNQLEAKKDSYDINKLGWYPFQLAFILQELVSITNPEDKYRNVVDLLWFPTGGGKTEAYLGLSAFTIFYRRIKAGKNKKSGAGVTIMMRYTLRLLTLQQYERAAAMICASELIRRKNPKLLGKEEISIGLWVGGALTPNKRKDAVKALDKIINEGFDSLREGDSNPCQILKCPHCGIDLKPANYNITDDKMKITCKNTDCEFQNGLPLYLVDEDIYRYKPTLIVSTVDKFARMTWEERVGDLFGLDTEYLPPELIIQDELHLISGPLGTITGLYEMAIDMFCQSKGIQPKIIASTATIRNAKSQILNLYGREHRQFPPQGIDIRDSYFAEESFRDDKPSRKYLGIMAPGKSATTMLVRLYAVMLYSTRYLKDLGYTEQVIDSFWTLTGYFNNLKQLGGAIVHVLDDVEGRLKYLIGTKFKEIANPAFSSGSNYSHYDELTSRKSSFEIGDVLKNLDVKYPNHAYDFIMASNMISVGVDVGRLSLMFVNGQPKSNAEYIQATSRVGRKTPGLVIVLQDASRSRDRSHYEQFLSYHSSIYKFVEATSLTPFSERARDRALHAVLISMCRHLIDGLKDNKDAKNVSNYRAKVMEFIKFIVDKAEKIDDREARSTEEQLNHILREWEYKAGGDLIYKKFGKHSGSPLLIEFENNYENGFKTLNSMRNVDIESKVYLER